MGFQNVKTVDLSMQVTRTLALLIGVLGPLPNAVWARAPAWEVTTVPAASLGCLLGTPEPLIALVACAGTECLPIPWQLEEHGADGDLIFDAGELASTDDPPRTLDANDEIVFMTADAGRAARAAELTAVECRVPLRVHRDGEDDRWIYAVAYASAAPRSTKAYVQYDVESDTLIGDGVTLGFRDRIPQYFAVAATPDDPAVNLLDRLKVRASARFLGLIPVSRDEGDLDAPVVGWRAGPVRIVRRQRQRIRVGWGIKSPRFTIDTYFSRTSATIPVAFRLNFPPTYFFSDIVVETVLDFRDLRGWRIDAPSLVAAVEIDAVSPPSVQVLNATAADWFALIGPDVQLVQLLEVSASLAPLDRRLAFRTTAAAHAPEAVPGEMPGVGYTLRGWRAVDRGVHAFAAVTYVLPRDQDLAAFLRERAMPAVVDVRPPLPNGD